MSFSDFFEITSNNYILLKPNGKLKQIEYSNILTETIKSILNKNKLTIVIYLILTLISILFVFVSSYYTKILIDKALNIYNTQSAIVIIIINSLLILTSTIILLLKRYLLNVFNFLLSDKIFSTINDKVFNFSSKVLNQITSGELMTNILEIDNYNMINEKLLEIIIYDFIVIIITTVLIIRKFNQIGWLLIIYIIIGIILITIINNNITQRNIRYKNEYYKRYKVLATTYESLITISYNQSQYEFQELISKEYQQMKLANNNLNNFILVRELLIEIWKIGLLILMNIAISKAIINKKLSINILLVFQNIFSLFIPSLINIGNISILLKEKRIISDKINNDFLEEKKIKKMIFKEEVFQIKYQDCSFSYEDKEIIKDFNYEISKGEMISVIGKSGSGKTTIFKLLHNEQKIKPRSLYINNIDILNYSSNSLKEAIRYVSDHEKIFSSSILNNITMYKPVNEQKLLEVTKVVGIDKIPKDSFGLEYQLFDNGSNISQGEKQRVILARALMSQASVIILDEATIHLDRKSELEVLNYLKTEGRIVIFISHRKSIFKKFDQELIVNDL